jgi:hypothetical protein
VNKLAELGETIKAALPDTVAEFEIAFDQLTISVDVRKIV